MISDEIDLLNKVAANVKDEEGWKKIEVLRLR